MVCKKGPGLNLSTKKTRKRELLDEIVQHANVYSPVANTMRNPVSFSIARAD